jgi:hypothetical protein
MANASWPASLPAFVDQQGYSETLPDVNIESPMEAGPPKVRPRTTVNWTPFTMSMRLTRAQYDVFVGFFNGTLSYGSRRFDWVHPYTRLPVTMRFRKPPPKFTPAGADMIATFQVDRLF